jgi:hypothetical protein
MNHQQMIKDLAASLGTSKRTLFQRMIFKSGAIGRLRERMIEENNVCGHCHDSALPLENNCVDTHIDHIWSMSEAADDFFSGAMPIGDVERQYNAVENLRAIHADCNQARRRRASGMEKKLLQ